jgi:beta-lactamase regulating signal transducer with metallopeptidase domain
MYELLLRAADWWLGTAVAGGLVLLVGCLLMRLARQPAARQRLGEYAVMAALLVGVLRLMPAWLAISWPTSAPAKAVDVPTASEMVFVQVAPREADGPWLAGAERGPDAADPGLRSSAPSTPSWTWQDAAACGVAAYLLVAAGLAMRWLLGQWALGRLLRQARPAAPRVRRLFTAMAASLLSPLPRLRLSRRLRAPVCFGLRRPAVLLPESMDEADDTRLRWVFAHELTHLRRRDPWSSWGLGLAQAVYFYLPWFWWVRRQVRLCQEYIADAAAAAAGAAADEYAEFLVSLAREKATPLGATGLGSSSDLLRRVQMLLQSSTRVQGSWPRGRSLVAAGGLMAVAVLAGGLGLRAAPAEDDKKADDKKVIVYRVADGDSPDGQKVIRLVVRADEEEDDKGDKKSDRDGKRDEKKSEKTIRRGVIVIDAGDGPVTIPLDGDNADVKKEIEKAMKKVRVQVDAKAKEHTEAIEKALELLRGELNDEQIKMLRRHLEEIRARKAGAEAGRGETDRGRRDGDDGRLRADAERLAADAKRRAADAERRAAEAGRGEADRARRQADEARRNADDVRRQMDAERRAVEDARRQAERAARLAEKGFMTEEQAKKLHDEMVHKLAEVHGDQPRVFAFQQGGGTRLGVRVEKPSSALADQLDLPKDRGMVVVEVTKDSPAGKAGIKASDILLEVDGKAVASDPGRFIKQIQSVKSDDEITVIVLRKGRKEKVSGIKLPEAKKDGPGAIWLEQGKDGVKIDGGDLKFVRPEVKVLDGNKVELVVPKVTEVAPGKFEVQVAPPAPPAPPALPKAPKAPKAPKPPKSDDGDASDHKEQHLNRSVSITVNDGKYTAKQTDDDVTITVTGTVDGGKVDIESIRINDGGSRETYRRLADVPAKHRDAVKRLISNTDSSPVRFHFEKKEEKK